MTDRHAGYIVTLADDIREDDAVHTISALKMIKGVISVQPVVADACHSIAAAAGLDEAMEYTHDLLPPRLPLTLPAEGQQ